MCIFIDSLYNQVWLLAGASGHSGVPVQLAVEEGAGREREAVRTATPAVEIGSSMGTAMQEAVVRH